MIFINRFVLACLFIGAGMAHCLSPEVFARIVPPFLPHGIALVYISGLFEIIGGMGVLIPHIRLLAGRGLIALLIAVWPANIYMAIVNTPLDGLMGDPIIQWVRVPFQFVLIWWVYRMTRNKTIPSHKTIALTIA